MTNQTIKAQLITLAVKTSPGVSIEEIAESIYGEYNVTDGRLEYAATIIRNIGQSKRPLRKEEATELSLRGSWEEALVETTAEKWAGEAINQDDELSQLEDELWSEIKTAQNGTWSNPDLANALYAIDWVRKELFGQDKYPSYDYEEGSAEFPELAEELQYRIEAVENYIVDGIVSYIPALVDDLSKELEKSLTLTPTFDEKVEQVAMTLDDLRFRTEQMGLEECEKWVAGQPGALTSKLQEQAEFSFAAVREFEEQLERKLVQLNDEYSDGLE